MLELPFDLSLFAKESGFAILVAIGVPLAGLLVFGATIRIPLLKRISGICAGTLALVIMPGFAMSILMVVSRVDGLHVLLSWLTLLLGCFSFVLFNHRRLAAVFHEYNQKRPAKTRGRIPRNKRYKKR